MNRGFGQRGVDWDRKVIGSPDLRAVRENSDGQGTAMHLITAAHRIHQGWQYRVIMRDPGQGMEVLLLSYQASIRSHCQLITVVGV